VCGERDRKRPSEENLTTGLHLAAPRLARARRPHPVALLPAHLLGLLEGKDVRDGRLGVAGRQVVVPVQVDLADQEHVLAADEVGAARDVGEEALLRAWANKVPFRGGGEDEVC
jgi:hypothetical protein